MNKNLLCIGHATLDTFFAIEDADLHCDIKDETCKVCFGFGAKIPVDDVRYGIGGGASNVAVGTTRLGISSSLLSVIGDDDRGNDIKQSLIDHSVDTKYLSFDNNATDQAVVLSYPSERTIFTYNHTRAYSIEVVDLSTIDNVFLSSVGNNIANLYDQIIDLKKNDHNIRLFYNPGSRELANALDDIQRLFPHIDYMIANVEEGCTALNTGLTRDQIEIEDLMSLLIDKGVKTVVLTDAERGVHVASFGSYFHVDSKPTKVEEMTGAGDAFASGFVGAILHDKDAQTAAKWGVTNSSSAIREVGAQNGLLSKLEIESQVS